MHLHVYRTSRLVVLMSRAHIPVQDLLYLPQLWATDLPRICRLDIRKQEERRAGWSGRQNNKGPNESPAVDPPLIELCICQILTETVPRKPGGSKVQSLAEECLWKTAYYHGVNC